MSKHFSILFFLCILTSCAKKTSEDCSCSSVTVAVDKYNYTIKTGSAEWNSAGVAGGLDSLYKLCQVPQTVLQNMSTLGIMQSLEDNPCLGNILLRTNLFQGRDEVLSRLNVSWELNKRHDAAVTIIAYYNQKKPCCANTLTDDLEKGNFAARWVLFDMVCTQDSLINQLQLSDKKQFAKIILEKYNVQIQYPSIFGLSKTTSVLVLSQLMINASFQPYIQELQSNSELNFFATTTQTTSSKILDNVLAFAKQFIKN